MQLRAIPLLFLGACSNPATSPPPPPPPAQHLYVGQDDIPGSIRAYTLPLTATSTPVATVPINANIALGVNATTLAITRLDNTSVSLFHLPLTSASTPYAVIASGSFGTPLLLASGVLYHGGVNKINAYTPPFTSTSTPSGSIATPGLSPGRLAIDSNGNIYETVGTLNTIGVVTGGVLTTTLTAAPGTIFRGLAASATQLFACEATGSAYHVYIYALPLTASATPAVIMNPNTSSANDCALDAGGNLYIATSGQVAVFAPPFTSTSTRTLTLMIPGTVQGIAIGP